MIRYVVRILIRIRSWFSTWYGFCTKKSAPIQMFTVRYVVLQNFSQLKFFKLTVFNFVMICLIVKMSPVYGNLLLSFSWVPDLIRIQTEWRLFQKKFSKNSSWISEIHIEIHIEMDYRSKFRSTNRNNKSSVPKSVIVPVPYKSVITVRSSMIRLLSLN